MPNIIYVLLLCFSQASQLKGKPLASAAPPAKAQDLRIESLSFLNAKALIGFPRATAMGHPTHCSVDGSTFIDVYAVEGSLEIKAVPNLYRVSSLGEVRTVRRSLPTNFTSFFVMDFYAGSQRLVSLIEAKRELGTSTPSSSKAQAFYLATSDLEGQSSTLTELALPFTPVKVAVFDSGKFLVSGFDEGNRMPLLAVLNADGSLDRRVDLDERELRSSNELRKTFGQKDTQPEMSEKTLRTAIAAGNFVPYGEKVLLVQAGSVLPIRVLNDRGEESNIHLTFPAGFVLENALTTDGGTQVVVRLREIAKFQELSTKHVILKPEDTIAVFDRLTGEAVYRFSFEGPRASEVTCAVNHKLTAVYYRPLTTRSEPNSRTPDNATQKPLDEIVVSTAPILP